jgi:hypothetical protein
MVKTHLEFGGLATLIFTILGPLALRHWLSPVLPFRSIL